MNPIKMHQAMNSPMIGYIRNIMGTVNAAKNPQEAINKMSESNPQVKEVMNMVNGKNPKDVFYAKCEEYGINPDVILGMLR